MKGFRTILFNSAQMAGLAEVVHGAYQAFPVINQFCTESKLVAVVGGAIGLYLRFQTTTPVGAAPAVAGLTREQIDVVYSMIKRAVALKESK